jgi:hypothetical protein
VTASPPPGSRVDTTSALRRRLEAVAALVVYGLAVPWLFRSWFFSDDLLPATPGPLQAMIEADLNLNIWILAWTAHAALAEPLRLLDGNIFHPATNTIVGSENMLAHLPFTAPALALGGDALTMLKVFLVESFALSGFGMFLYVRHHTRQWWPAMIAGAAYTFTAFRVETVPQPQYLGMAFFPLALLSIDLYLETARRRWLGALLGALVLQALSCVYIGFFTFLLYPVYALVGVARTATGATEFRNRLLALALAGVGAALVLIPLAAPYALAQRTGMIPEHDLRLLQIASWSPELFFSTEFTWRVGPVAIVLVMLGLLARARPQSKAPLAERAGPESRFPSTERSRPEAALWITLAVAGLLALGPTIVLGGLELPLPYRLARQWIPGFASIRVPIRFILMVAALLAALAGMAFGRWSAGRARPMVAVTGTLLTLFCIWAAAPTPHAVAPSGLASESARVYSWLSRQTGEGAVLEIPGQSTEQDLIGNLRNSRYMVASTRHWRPLLNGYTAYPPTSAGFYSAAIRELPSRSALDLLVAASDLRWLVLHRNELTAREARRWPDGPIAGLTPVARFGASEVFVVDRPAVPIRREDVGERMEAATDTLEGTPRSILGPACARGRILDVEWPEHVPLFLHASRIPVRIRNEGDCTWPALGLLPTRLVGLHYRWFGPGGEALENEPEPPLFRLLADVAPGATSEGAIMLAPPRGGPGPRTLEVRLVQDGSPTPIATVRNRVRVGGRATGVDSGGNAQEVAPTL